MLLILGFVPTLIFSWVYEMTPQGLKREKDVDRSQSITPHTGRKINILIVVLLVLAIATVLIDRLMPREATVAEAPVEEQAPDAAPPGSDPSVGNMPTMNRLVDGGTRTGPLVDRSTNGR